MNRWLWSDQFTNNTCPRWPCPICGKGAIKLMKESFNKETVKNQTLYSDEECGPDCIEYIFTAWAQCTEPRCTQKFAISGTGGIAPEYGPDGAVVLEEYFVPKACHPMPEIITIPKKCPNDVKVELRTAFALFWAYGAACANRIRVALECLLDYANIPRKKINNTGEESSMNLHKRIEEFQRQDQSVGAQLMALKWLGNTGSHHADISRDNLLDAFEIMEHALEEIVNKRSAKVAKTAEKMTKKHSPH